MNNFLPNLQSAKNVATDFFTRVSLRAQILLIKQLAMLLRSGVPLFSALTILKEKSISGALKKILADVAGNVENGKSLSGALYKYERIFGPLTIHIIAVGEISGTLNNNLDYLAASLKRKLALRSKIISASVYPIFIVFATLVITVLLVVLVFPKIMPIFKSVHYPLPWSTQLLIFISSAVQHHGLLIMIGVIVFTIGAWQILKIKTVHCYCEKIIIRTPFFGGVTKTYNLGSMCWILGLLLTSGVPLAQALDTTSKTMGNTLYEDELSSIAQIVTKGETMSAYLQGHPLLFSPMMAQMLSIGESTGKLNETLAYLADIYQEEMDEITKNLSTTVEPLLLLFMGLLVGFVAISIITPIYGITQHLTPR